MVGNKNIFKNKLSFQIDYRFGAHKEYYVGDIVVWGGHEPIISRVVRKSDRVYGTTQTYQLVSNNYPRYNGCSINLLRKATEQEKKSLGNLPFKVLTNKESGYYDNKYIFSNMVYK